MSAQNVSKDVREFLEPFIADTEFKDEDDIFALGLVNSLMAMQLVLFLEKTYKIKFEGDDLDLKNFRSIQQISELIGRKLAA